MEPEGGNRLELGQTQTIFGDSLASGSPTMSTLSEDEKDRSSAKNRGKSRYKINLRLKLSPFDQTMIQISNEPGDETDDSEEIEEETNQEGSGTEREKTPSSLGKFREKLDSDDKNERLAAKEGFERDSDSSQTMSKNEAPKKNFDSTKPASNNEASGDQLNSTKTASNNEASAEGDSTQTFSNNEAAEKADSTQTLSNNNNIVGKGIEMVDDDHQQHSVSCIGVSTLSPYCHVMVQPSWETSKLYRHHG